MGRMKHGKPNPHNDRSKVIVKKKTDEKKKNESKEEDENKEDKNYVPEEYRKRLLKSNHDRYDEPSDNSGGENDDGEIIDETKSLEYIKSHYSGVSSHFQFDDEKEWNDDESQSNKDDDILQLDLLQLSREISQHRTYDKLNLKDLNEGIGYCVENLAEISETLKIYRESPEKKIQSEPFTWSYQGIEQYEIETNSSVRMNTSSYKKNDSHEKLSSLTRKSQNRIEEISHEVFTKEPSKSSVSEEGQGTGKESTAVLTTVEKHEKTIKDKTEEDLDLDELLSSPVQMNENKKSDENREESRLQETGAKELDDWLDSIL